MKLKKINVLENFYCAMSKCLDYLNEYVFDSLFNEIVFVIQGERACGMNSYGVFCPDKWKIDDKKYCEISLTAEFITGRDPKELLNTLTHELIHFKAFVLDIKDTNSRNKFHNKEFKKLGEEIGAIFEDRDDKIGYSNFKPNEHLNKIYEDCLKENNIEEVLKDFKRIKKIPEKTVKKFFKYMCPACNSSIKAPLNAEIICGADGTSYEFKDKLPLPELEDITSLNH